MIKICERTCYFGKQNSTLNGFSVPLATFSFVACLTYVGHWVRLRLRPMNYVPSKKSELELPEVNDNDDDRNDDVAIVTPSSTKQTALTQVLHD